MRIHCLFPDLPLPVIRPILCYLLVIATMLLLAILPMKFIVMIHKSIMHKAAKDSGEVYKFSVLLLPVVKLFFALGFGYALGVLHVIMLFLSLRFIIMLRTWMSTLTRTWMAKS